MPIALAVAAGFVATLSLGDRTEVRVRATPGTTPPLGVDLANGPTVKLEGRAHHWDVHADYSPYITESDVTNSAVDKTPQLLHGAAAGVAWHWRRTRISLEETARYGQQNFTYLNPSTPLPGQAVPTVQLLPQNETLRLGFTRTYLGLQTQPARRWFFTLAPSYSVGGGLDSFSRTLLPVNQSARVDTSLEWSATRRDRIGTVAAAWQGAFSSVACTLQDLLVTDPVVLASLPRCQPSVLAADASERWTHSFSRSTSASLAVGVSSTWWRHNPGDPVRYRPYPLVEAIVTSLRKGPGTSTEYSLSARIAPILDYRLGILDQRGQVIARSQWKWGRSGLQATMSLTQGLPPQDPSAATFIGGEISSTYALAKEVEISYGTRGAWQTQLPVIQNAFTAIEFVALTLTMDPVKL